MYDQHQNRVYSEFDQRTRSPRLPFENGGKFYASRSRKAQPEAYTSHSTVKSGNRTPRQKPAIKEGPVLNLRILAEAAASLLLTASLIALLAS